MKFTSIFHFIFIFSMVNAIAGEKQDYAIYHQQVIEAEKLIGSEKYSDALQVYESLFDNYDFVFLREYQIATQLALFLEDKTKAKKYLRQGILAGWKLKSIKRNKYISQLKKEEDWNSIKTEYRVLRHQYESNLNEELQKQVKKMFSKDQWKAIGALFTFSSDAQDRYAEKKFAPHSEKQMAESINIIESYGYPGEKLVGNYYWMSTILSHHNSISQEYVQQDTLYLYLKPKLVNALKNGQISPFELALIDEWYHCVKNDRETSMYGILEPPSQSELSKSNELRAAIYMRPIEVRNQLVDIEKKTGMDFYLNGGPWIEGKVEIRE
ncbi:MAG: hypothetical protein R3E32_19775 [Chitinophagales bacterium]